MSDPNAVDQVELLDMLGQGLRDNQGHIGAGPALVVPQFSEPSITPRFGALSLPQNDAGRLADGSVNLLHYVCTKLTFADWVDRVSWETFTQKLLELKLQNLTL
jgi:hypothetical protein